MSNGRSARSNCSRMGVEWPSNRSWIIVVINTLRIRFLSVTYRAPNLIVTSKGVGITRSTPNWGSQESRPLGKGAWLTAYKPVLPHLGYHAEFDRCWSNGMNIDMPGKKLLQSHSRSSDLTQIDRGTCDFLLTFRNMGPCTVSKILRDIDRNLRISPTWNECCQTFPT